VVVGPVTVLDVHFRRTCTLDPLPSGMRAEPFEGGAFVGGGPSLAAAGHAERG
jgi:hypothetical protein